ILQENPCYTSTVVIAELSDKYAAEQHDFWGDDLEFIRTNSIVVPFDTELAANAGKIKHTVRKKYKNNFSLIDAGILATSIRLNAMTLTGDYHFKLLKNVEYLG
ncbi:MAG: PIN domain-containing protein, partial [Candidatus Diapherotrites archaeon]|nr:PIN domain-containing protein [Candidatus Diapherotrites archaeon]